MRLALIPPVDLRWYTHATNYQLMLPQVALTYPKYRKTYLRHTHTSKPSSDGPSFVILDNGIAEGEPISPHMLAYSARLWNVHEVVMPDVIGDKDATIEASKAFYLKEHSLLDMQPHKPRIQTMFVVQGQTFAEVMDCARWATDREWIDTIGIPRHLLSTLDNSMARVKVANDIQEYGMLPQMKIHFLGASSKSPLEVMHLGDPAYTNQDHVRGMDTSMPFNYAFHRAPIRNEVHIDRPQDYFALSAALFDTDIVFENVLTFLRAAKEQR